MEPSSIVLAFIIGFFCGSWVMYDDFKQKFKKGFIPYILSDGSLQWKESRKPD